MAVPIGLAIDSASGVLLTVLGVFVATRRPRRRINYAFAVFSIGWGVTFAVNNLLTAFDAEQYLGLLSPFALAAAGAIVYLALRFPRRLDAPWWVILIASGPMAALVVGSYIAAQEPGVGTSPDAMVLVFIAVGTLWGALLFALVTFSWAGSRSATRSDSALFRQYALLSIAFAMDPGIRAGIESYGPPVLATIILPAVLLAAGFWIVATARTSGASARLARNVGLGLLALPLVGMVTTPLLGGYPAAADSGVFGVARTVTVLIIAYAILRHQLLGIDVKIKWTIKQSTVAAAFIAVFFVVSEGAAALFEAQTGNAIAGIVAAGALVFAIAPLQRFADRVSDRAMPGVKPIGKMTEDERVALYRSQLAVAWSDGTLSADERAMLKDARDKLGIPANLALELEEEVAP